MKKYLVTVTYVIEEDEVKSWYEKEKVNEDSIPYESWDALSEEIQQDKAFECINDNSEYPYNVITKEI